MFVCVQQHQGMHNTQSKMCHKKGEGCATGSTAKYRIANRTNWQVNQNRTKRSPCQPSQPLRERLCNRLKDAQQQIGRQCAQRAASRPVVRGCSLEGVPALQLLLFAASSRARTVGLRAAGQWRWVAGLQLPSLAANSTLRGAAQHECDVADLPRQVRT